MKIGSTLLLKAVILFIGMVVLAICAIGLPVAIRAELAGDFDYLPILLGLYVPAVPFFIALYQAFKLLNYIDASKVFSNASIATLKNIKFCAVVISSLFAICMPYVLYVAQNDDAPGLALIGLVIIGASFVIAAFAALMQQLIQNAVDIKAENDLTV